MRQVIQYSPTAVCCDSARSTCRAQSEAQPTRFSASAAAAQTAAGTRPALVAAQRLHDEQVVQLVPALREMHLACGGSEPRQPRSKAVGGAHACCAPLRGYRPFLHAPHGQCAWLRRPGRMASSLRGRVRGKQRARGAPSRRCFSEAVPSGSRCGATTRASRTGAAPTGTLRCGRGAHAACVSAARPPRQQALSAAAAPRLPRLPRTKVGHARHGLQRVEASVRLVRPEGVHKANDLVHQSCVDGLLDRDDAAGRPGAGRRRRLGGAGDARRRRAAAAVVSGRLQRSERSAPRRQRATRRRAQRQPPRSSRGGARRSRGRAQHTHRERRERVTLGHRRTKPNEDDANAQSYS